MSTEAIELVPVMIDEVKELEQEIAPVVRQASAITVRTKEERFEAMDFLKNIKGAQKRVADFFLPIKNAAHIAWKRTTEGEAKLLDPLKSAESTIKGKILSYDQEEERARLAEQRRLQALADEAARKERERLEKEAAKLKTPELREARLEAAAAIIAPTVMISAPEKPKGESTRKVWKARLIDKKALIVAAAGGNDLAGSFLAYDEKAANKFASTIKGAVSVPGVGWFEESILAVGGRQ